MPSRNEWKLLARQDAGFGWTATIKCMACKREFSLAEHVIENDGKVRGRVYCPYLGCRASQGEITLNNWDSEVEPE